MAWAPDYATGSQLSDYLSLTGARAADATVNAAAVTAASRAIDQACNRQFGLVSAPQARYYTAAYDRRRARWVVPIDDLMTITGLVVHVDTDDNATYESTVTEYQLKDVNAAANSRPWTSLVIHPDSDVQPSTLEAGVEVTARYGWTTVPSAISSACLLQAARIAMRKDAPFGIAGSPQTGSELRLLAKIDPDVEVMIRAYRRVWGAV